MTTLTAALADRYRVERELGAGGMATVYLAHDLKHDRPVAIKVLHPELGAVLGAERFLSEIRTTANLQHPNILPLFDSGAVEGLVFYVMPFVEGETLRARMAREGQLAVADAVKLAQGVASALDYAHRHGVIHRDIKPENILLQDGQALVADFGVALAVSNAGGARITQTGISVGTPQYMSPEQAAAERQLDGRSDQYSLAAVLYEMLAGEPPFTGPSAPAILTKLMTERVPLLTTRRPTVPAGVADAVHRALEKVPADRFATAAEFAAALTRERTGEDRARSMVAFGARLPSFASVTLASLLLLGAGWALRAFTHESPSAPSPTSRLSVLMPAGVIINTGETPTLAVSPDGRWLAYSSSRGIELRPIDAFESRVVEVPGGAWGPFFSPDSRWLGYLTQNGVWKTPIGAGSPVQISRDWLYHATWGDDGNIYFNTAAGASGISVMSANATDIRQVTVPDSANGEAFHMSPEFLPGGKLLYTATGPTGGWAQARLMVTDLKDPSGSRVVLEGASSARFIAPDQLIYLDASGRTVARRFDAERALVSGDPLAIDSVRSTHFGAIAHVAVSRTGTVAYIPGSEQGKGVIVERDGTGRVLRELFSGYPGWPSLSPDGRTFAFVHWSGRDAQLWTIDLVTGVRSRQTFAATENEGTIWSADGARYLYSRQALGGVREVLVGSLAGQDDGALLFSRRSHAHVHAWSPDGRWVVLNQFEGARSNLHLVDVNAPDSGKLIVENADNADLSADGRWLAYCVREDEGPRVYIVSFPDLSKRAQVTSTDACWPRFSADGRFLYFMDRADFGSLGSLFAVQRTTSEADEWGMPRRLHSASVGPFVVAERPTRFLSIEIDSTHLAREIRVVTGWSAGDPSMRHD